MIAGVGGSVRFFRMTRISVSGVTMLIVQGLGVLPVVPFAGNRDKKQGGGKEMERFHPRRM